MLITMTSHVTGKVNIVVEDMNVQDDIKRSEIFAQLEALAIIVANDKKVVDRTTLSVKEIK